ncbi:DUF4019 domain-containing protein [Burkholderia sp. NLJ2]|uniref:DUF4019 domain-containing protein n=1 Tax=Burkholderia sp. NLJ2 TaxID=3090699 RepID=UPI003C6C754E
MNARTPVTRAKWLIGCAAASIAIGAHAQSAGESADTLLRDSDAVFKQLDAGQYGAVWSDAAAFVKARIKQDQFAAEMQRARQSVGAVSHRGWAQVTRIRYTNASAMPGGLYANVDYALGIDLIDVWRAHWGYWTSCSVTNFPPVDNFRV